MKRIMQCFTHFWLGWAMVIGLTAIPGVAAPPARAAARNAPDIIDTAPFLQTTATPSPTPLPTVTPRLEVTATTPATQTTPSATPTVALTATATTPPPTVTTARQLPRASATPTTQPSPTPTPIEVAPANGAGQSPFLRIAIAGGVFLLCGMGIFLLARRGGLKDALTAAFSMSKWRMQGLKLTADINGVEKQKAKAVGELGVKAWQLRIAHPEYSQIYEALEKLEAAQEAQRTQIAGLEQQVRDVNEKQGQLQTHFGGQIKDEQTQRQAAQERLNRSKTALKATDQQLRQLQKQVQQTTSEMRVLQKRLTELQNSSTPGREAQIQAVNDALATLQQGLTTLEPQQAAAQAAYDQQQADQQPIVAEVAGCDATLKQLQQAMQAALEPGDNTLKSLEKQIKSAQETLKQLGRQQQEQLALFGPQVNIVRPPEANLQSDYARLDQIGQQLAALTAQDTLVKARLATLDQKTLWRFYGIVLLMVGGLGSLVFIALDLSS